MAVMSALCHKQTSDRFGVAHCEGDNKVVLDCVRERKPRFVPAAVVAEFAEVLSRYGVHEVFGDRVGGGFHADEWARNRGAFRPSPNDTSENYLRALPMLLAGRARLLDNATLRQQLSSLERHVLAGREVVKHPQLASAHDDVATAVCGALVMAVRLQVQEVPIVAPIIVRAPVVHNGGFPWNIRDEWSPNW